MCGIFGWIPDKRYRDSNPQPFIDKIYKTMAHRGPDDRGHAIFGEALFKVLIAQVRLSIIDLSPTGHQPMFSEDGRYAITYNGEV